MHLKLAGKKKSAGINGSCSISAVRLRAAEEARGGCTRRATALFPAIAFPVSVCERGWECWLVFYDLVRSALSARMCVFAARVPSLTPRHSLLSPLSVPSCVRLTRTLSALFSLLPLKCLCELVGVWAEAMGRIGERETEKNGREGLKCSHCFYIMAPALVRSISCPGKPDITHTHSLVCTLATFCWPTKPPGCCLRGDHLP